MTQSGNGTRGSHYHLSASEGPQVNDREILAHNQDISPHSSPIPPEINRKRKWEQHPSDGTQSPSKRPTRDTDRVMLDIERAGSSTRTTPTAAEQRREPTEDIHGTTPTNGGEFFSNANNTIINNSTMTAIGVQQVYVQRDLSYDPALQWLKEHAMKGAAYDSGDRDPPPRCHPGTRTTIIQKVQDWLGSSKREQNLLWLRGTAGVGKSAIVQTVAETLSETDRLGASLFFSRPNGRSNPRQVLPTLAYQFAIQDPSYKEYITQFVLTNPESLDKAMKEQFRVLIVEPFVCKRIRSGKAAWAVTLDGLDECGEDPNGRRHSNDTQCDIVRLISGFVQQYPTAPLIWVIASRPEVHLKAVFSEMDVVPSFWEEDVPVDSTEACKDVEKFLHREFTELRQKYPDHIPNSPWPTSDQFLKIAHAALGLFIFAEVVVRFIGDPEVGNPIAQLKCLLVVISKMPLNNRQNPLANLDVIYLAILDKIPPSTLQTTKRLLGFLILLNRKSGQLPDCNFHDLCQILEISKDTGITTIRHLHSVLYFAESGDLGESRPRIYHASFRDFLEDKFRSHKYLVDKRLFTNDLFIQSLYRVAQAQFSSDPDSPLSPLSDEDEPGRCTSQFVTHVLWGDFSLDGVRLLNLKDFSCLSTLVDAQLRPLLESLNFLKVLQYSAPRPLWDFSEGNERELSRRGILSCTTLGSLSINWGAVSMSISELGLHKHVQVDTTSGIQTEPHEDSEDVQLFRRRSKAAASDTKVRVWGHRKSGCCVAVVRLGSHIYALTGIPSVTT